MKKVLLFIFFMNLFLLPSLSVTNSSLSGLEVENPNKLGYLVEDLSQDGLNIGLSKEDIETKIKLKFRQYNIEPTELSGDIHNYLYVNVNVVGENIVAFNVTIDFERLVRFNVYNITYTHYGAATYNRSFTGVVGANSANDAVMNSLDKLLDNFVSNYLDVNSSRMKK
jgi:hypothetical protein